MSKSAVRLPHQPAAVPAPLAGAPPSHQPGRAAAGLSCLAGEEFEAVYGGSTTCPDGAWHIANCSRCDVRLRPARALAEANARAEHWAVQADRLAGQVEAMRAVMLEVAEQISDEARSFSVVRPAAWAERLRRAAGGEGGE